MEVKISAENLTEFTFQLNEFFKGIRKIENDICILRSIEESETYEPPKEFLNTWNKLTFFVISSDKEHFYEDIKNKLKNYNFKNMDKIYCRMIGKDNVIIALDKTKMFLEEEYPNSKVLVSGKCRGKGLKIFFMGINKD